ncbi:MAG: hypothetical protein SGPRY_012538 [Prymnesium sp.]
MFRRAFTPHECERIAQLFSQLPAESDVRKIPLLPNMPEDSFRVARLNRFDDGSLLEQGKLDFISSRLLSLLQSTPDSPLPALGGLDHLLAAQNNGSTEAASCQLEALHARVDFTLLHEFEVLAEQPTPQFDWHADTKPGDVKARSLNVGTTLIGAEQASALWESSDLILEKSSHDAQLSIQVIEVTSGFTRCQGDMYLYPAGVVHRVAPVTHGIRLTFVMALVDIEASGCSSHDAATGSTLVPAAAFAGRRASYWEHVEVLHGLRSADVCLTSQKYKRRLQASYQRLTQGHLARESKLHILHGEFLEASGRSEEAHAAYCEAYRGTGEEAAAKHASQFMRDGEKSLQGPQGPDLRLAQHYFSMAVSRRHLCLFPF